jgi:hypothetical protein
MPRQQHERTLQASNNNNNNKKHHGRYTVKFLVITIGVCLGLGMLLRPSFCGGGGDFLLLPSFIESTTTTTTTTTPTQQQKKRKPKLADGCHHIFLDAGANKGIHTRFLFEPSQYPKAQNAMTAFDAAFGKERDNRDICAFGFEPNPGHVPRQHELRDKYAAMGWRYVPIHAGVGDQENGTLAFYHNDPPLDGKTGTSNSEWGFSMRNRRNRGRKEEVPILHFAKWMQREILDRKPPARVYGKYESSNSNNYQYPGGGGKVVLKLDIEGMEFIVVPSLIFSGALCQAVDYMFGEYHAPGHVPVREPMQADGQGALPKFGDDWRTARDQFQAMWKAMKTVRPEDCRTRWLDLFDVEDYLHDGIPWPEPSNE